MIGIEDADARDIVRKFQIVVRIFTRKYRQRVGLFDQLHCLLYLAIGEDLVSLDVDLLDLDRGSFVDLECEFDRIGRSVFGYRLDCRILMSLFGKHRLDHALDLLCLSRFVG